MSIFVNGKKLTFKSCGATLKTSDLCYLKNGSTKNFPNTATFDDAIKTATKLFIEGNPACNQSSQLSTTKGSEEGVAGVSSGTIGGPCDFITGSPNVFIESIPALRAGDLGVANNKNTDSAPINFS